MVCRAAVKVYDKRQDKEMIIPCHRHCDAFLILKEFGYRKGEDFKEIEQGFLNEHGEFLSRIDAWHEAKRCNQFTQEYKDELAREIYHPATPRQLFSEDVW
jgi:hypothetical protein